MRSVTICASLLGTMMLLSPSLLAAPFDTKMFVKSQDEGKTLRVVIQDPDGIHRIAVRGRSISPIDIQSDSPGPRKIETLVSRKGDELDPWPIEILVEDSRGGVAKHQFKRSGLFILATGFHDPDSGEFRWEQKVRPSKVASEVNLPRDAQENIGHVEAEIVPLDAPNWPTNRLGGFLVVTGRIFDGDRPARVLVELAKPGDPWQFELHVLRGKNSDPE